LNLQNRKQILVIKMTFLTHPDMYIQIFALHGKVLNIKVFIALLLIVVAQRI